MPLKPTLSLRQKSILYGLIVLSPVVLLSYFLVNENSAFVEHHGLDSMSTRARLVQQSIDELIDSTIWFLDNLAQTPVIKERDKAASNQLFASILPLYPNFTSLGSVDEEGRFMAGVQREGSSSFTINDRPYFQEAMRSGEPVVSGRLMGRATDQPVFAVAVPIRNGSGRPSGIVLAGISLKQIQQRLDRLGKEAGDVIVVDSDGVVLSHPDWQYVTTRTGLKSLSPIDLALSGKEGTMEYKDPLDGKNWLWAYQPLTKAPWAVVVKSSMTAVYSPADDALAKWLFYLFGALATALVLALLLAERIAAPLRRLTRRAATVAPPGSVGEISQSRFDDLHQLTHVFNRICQALAQTSEELADVKGELAEQATKLEVLAQKAIEAREEERRRLAMNIHDGVLQLIAVAQGEARLARAAAIRRPDLAATRLGQLDSVLEQALLELRGIARGVNPPALEEVGLVHAIYNHLAILKEAFNVPHLSLRVSGDAYPLDPDLEASAFRIVQESLANAGKHAQAHTVEVFVDFASTHLGLTIADDGKGFDMWTARENSSVHCGLTNMRSRAEEVGGTCIVLSMPGMGTRVEVEIPLKNPTSGQAPLMIGAKE